MRHKLDIKVMEARKQLVGDRDLFSVSELCHENSKITAAAPGVAISREVIRVAPSGFKRYQHAKCTPLPEPKPLDGNLWDSVIGRRSCRTYSGRPLEIEQLGTLAFLMHGIQASGRRTVPSAGGLYPLELYVISGNVTGRSPGLDHYDPRQHGLTRLASGDFLQNIAEAIFVPEALEGAAAVFVLSAMFGRSKVKYGERAYRFALMEAGHATQNLCLAAEAAGLGACPIGGFIDDQMNDLIHVDGVEEAVLYLGIVGQFA